MVTFVALSGLAGAPMPSWLLREREAADYVLLPEQELPDAAQLGALLSAYSPRAILGLAGAQRGKRPDSMVCVVDEPLAQEDYVVAGLDRLMLNALETAAYARLRAWLAGLLSGRALSILLSPLPPRGSLCEGSASQGLRRLICDLKPSLAVCHSDSARAVIDRLGQTIVLSPGHAGLGERALIRAAEGLGIEVRRGAG